MNQILDNQRNIQIKKKLDQIATSILNAGMLVYYRSLQELKEIMNLIQNKDGSEIRAQALLLQGRVLSRMGRKEEGLLALSEGLEISHQLPGVRSQILDSLARLFTETNQSTLATLYFNRSLELKREIGDKLGEGISLQGLALHHAQLGEYNQAIVHYKKSLRCHQLTDNHHGVTNVISRLASVMLETRNFTQVEKLLEQAATCTSADSPSYSHNLGIEAVLCWAHYGDEQKAIGLFNEAIRKLRRAGDDYGIGIIHLRWGYCCQMVDKQKDAARAFKKSIFYFEKSGVNGRTAEATLALDMVSPRTPRKKRIDRLKKALRMAYAEGTVPCQKKLEQRLQELSEAQYLQLMIESSSPGLASLESRYLSGNREDASILFADVVGFSEYSEQRDPHEVFGILNGMYDSIQRAFDETGGIVDCHMGDGIMVIFLAREKSDHAVRAFEAGKRLQKYVSEFNAIIEKSEHPPIRIRVGVNSGDTFIGRVGAKNRWTFSAIGSTTNLASRIEAMAQPGTVMISNDTYQRLQDRTNLVPDGLKNFKGFEKPVKTFVWKQEQ